MDEILNLRLTVNGRPLEERVPVRTSLWELLHKHLGLRDVRYGCGEGVCGACTVLLDGEPVCSCLMLAAQAEGGRVETASGLKSVLAESESERFGLLREHLLGREAFQCGYCACGMMVSATHCLNSGRAQALEAVREAISGNLCRCTGYKLIEEAISAAGAGEAAPSAREHRADLRAKLDGSAQYPTDYHVKDALVGRVLWSDWPSAKIRAIDISEAKAVPGVEAVLTYRDIPGRNVIGSTFVDDQPLLAVDRVRSMSDAVALVAAKTDLAARRAIQRIRVTYEPLTPVTDVLEAVKPGSPQVGGGGNVIAHVTETRGDVEAAFKEADLIVEGTYRCTINDHACMELVGGTGWLEREKLILSLPTQTPHVVRKGVAQALKLREERISVVSPLMGGAFGKYLAPSVDGYLALLVFSTRKAVRLVLDRDEVLTRTTKRHPFVGHYRLGLKNDGSFLALDANILTDAGPYVSLTPVVAAIFAAEATGAYEIPAITISSRGVLTNNLLSAPMRGFGSQQINFGIECVVDKAARQLGTDPGELRRKNYRKTETPASGAGVKGGENWLDKSMERVVNRLGARRPQAPEGWLLGRGVASIHAKYGYPYGLTDRFTARVRVDSGGSFVVESDISDAGTGAVAGISRLVANCLELDEPPRYEQSQAAVDDPSGVLFTRGSPPSSLRRTLYRLIEGAQTKSAALLQAFLAEKRSATVARVTHFIARPVNVSARLVNFTKSLLFPYGLDSFNPRISGSRAMFMVGRAALDAAERLKDSALAVAARSLDVARDELVVKGDGISHRSNSSLKITWAELAKQAGGVLAAAGEAHLPSGPLLDPVTGNQTGPVDSAFASHGCDLAVNPETGAVRILRYVACHDVGRMLNPAAVRGQLFGGIAMGIGQALFEHIAVAEGKVQTAGLHDYLVPSSLDLPAEFELEILESKGGLGPGGAKGVGEASAVAAPIAVANALYDALGVQPSSIPATPEDIVNYCEMSLKARAVD